MIRLALSSLLLVISVSGGAAGADIPLAFDASKIGGPNSGAQAELYRPQGTGPFPAMVVLHGCAGIIDNHRGWAARLASWGYAALLVDSFRPRRVNSVCYGGGSPSFDLRAQDAFNAAIYLRTLSDILPDRIGVIGFSHGGGAALQAVLKRLVPVDRGGRPFAAGVAFYPPCNPNPPYSTPATDILILIGRNDDFVSASACEKLVAGKAAMPHAPVIKVYPNAVHVFDGPGAVRLVVDHMMGGNAEAREDAYLMTRTFLDERLKPK